MTVHDLKHAEVIKRYTLEEKKERIASRQKLRTRPGISEPAAPICHQPTASQPATRPFQRLGHTARNYPLGAPDVVLVSFSALGPGTGRLATLPKPGHAGCRLAGGS